MNITHVYIYVFHVIALPSHKTNQGLTEINRAN